MEHKLGHAKYYGYDGIYVRGDATKQSEIGAQIVTNEVVAASVG